MLQCFVALHKGVWSGPTKLTIMGAFWGEATGTRRVWDWEATATRHRRDSCATLARLGCQARRAAGAEGRRHGWSRSGILQLVSNKMRRARTSEGWKPKARREPSSASARCSMHIGKMIPLALVALAMFGAGYGVAQLESARDDSTCKLAESASCEQEKLLRHSQGQVEDAAMRWAAKSGGSPQRVLQQYQARSMFIPTTNQGLGMTCIELKLRGFDVGGEPVYCYKNNTTELVAEYSDVE